MKKLPNLTFFMLFFLSVSLFMGCKKDMTNNSLTDAEKIKQAKSNYEQQQKFQKVKITSSKGKEAKLIFVPDWANAKVDEINSTSIITMPVKTNLDKLFPDTKFSLIVSEENNDYEFKTLSIHSLNNESEELSSVDQYNLAYGNNKTSEDNKIAAEVKVYSPTFKVEKNLLYKENKIKNIAITNDISDSSVLKDDNNTLATVIVTVCIDYFLIVDTYNSSGGLIDSETTYLGRFCNDTTIETTIDWIAPTDGEATPSDTTKLDIEFGDAESTGLSITAIADTVKNVSWQCYSASQGKIKFISYETIRSSTYRTGAIGLYVRKYNVKSLTHQSILSEGEIDGQDVNALFANYLDNSDPNVARVEVVFKDKRSFVQNGTNRYKYSKDITARKSWSKQELGWGDKYE